MSDAELIVRCSCHSPEHMVVFDRWEWDTPYPHTELIISTHLGDYQPWWKRLLRAAEYALTAKTKRYMWAETVVRLSDAVRIRDYLDAYLAASGMEARSGETEGLDPKDDSPTAEGGDAQSPDGADDVVI